MEKLYSKDVEQLFEAARNENVDIPVDQVKDLIKSNGNTVIVKSKSWFGLGVGVSALLLTGGFYYYFNSNESVVVDNIETISPIVENELKQEVVSMVIEDKGGLVSLSSQDHNQIEAVPVVSESREVNGNGISSTQKLVKKNKNPVKEKQLPTSLGELVLKERISLENPLETKEDVDEVGKNNPEKNVANEHKNYGYKQIFHAGFDEKKVANFTSVIEEIDGVEVLGINVNRCVDCRKSYITKVTLRLKLNGKFKKLKFNKKGKPISSFTFGFERDSSEVVRYYYEEEGTKTYLDK